MNFTFTDTGKQIMDRAEDVAAQAELSSPSLDLIAACALTDAQVIKFIQNLGINVPHLVGNMERVVQAQINNQDPLQLVRFDEEMARLNSQIFPYVYKLRGNSPLDGLDIVLSILLVPVSSGFKSMLNSVGLNQQVFLAHYQDYRNQQIFSRSASGQDQNNPEFPGGSVSTDSFLINLNQKVLKVGIDPVIGREEEIERVVHILSRRKKNNIILVGEAGTGKTAIAEGLAKRITEGNCHDSLKGVVVFSLDIAAMTAGTKFRGEFEERLKKAIEKMKNTPNSVLFIDEIHTIIGSGSAGSGTLDAANILKPALANGELRCIGATTYKEYRNIFEKDIALTRRFQKVDVTEPSIANTIQILVGLKSYYEKHHGVTYQDDAIKEGVELASKYITDRFMPDKAIDVMDEAGAYVKLNPDNKDKIVTKEVVEKVVAKIARIPEKTIVGSERDLMKNLRLNLKASIFGQDEAIEKVVNTVQLGKSGLRFGEKPLGNFLFAGPTGVGKTELAKKLAESLGYKFSRFDMSEFMEKHNVSKLIGAPPGYVGFDQEGALTSTVSKNPNTVILLDEVEKAHPDVLNVLLQVMDYGTLTDNYGKKIDFRQAIIIMTSNIGAAEVSKRGLGISINKEKDNPVPTDIIEKAFPPELRNRLDGIIWFNKLGEETIAEVLDKNLLELDFKLLEKGVNAVYTTEVKKWLAREGHDPNMGARPMARLIQEKIALPISSEILYGKLQEGGQVVVDLKDNAPAFSFKKTPKKKEKVSEKAD